jgi:hypothetical protein
MLLQRRRAAWRARSWSTSKQHGRRREREYDGAGHAYALTGIAGGWGRRAKVLGRSVMEILRRHQWLILALLAAVALYASCRDGGTGSSQAKQGLALLAKRPGEQLQPFPPERLSEIVGNPMHEAHFAAQVQCGQCHLSTDPLPAELSHQICGECHPKREMAKSVWTNHCLACHYFLPHEEEIARKPAELTKTLCKQCHSEQDEFGGHLYASCTDTTGEMVLCDHCHRPHDKLAPAAISLCVNCHKDISKSRHPKGADTKCSLCHKPHSPTLQGDKICVSCHGQAADVIVHRIEKHPKDCLQCHKAHFTTIEIKGVCSDCHEGRVYREGRNVPAKHKDCENCHRLSDFKFKGTTACAGCHKKEGAIASDSKAPMSHRRCLTCHDPHTWRATFERNCDDCHDLTKVEEHNVPYHPKDCKACHDPHNPLAMPKSGDCDGCHQMDQKVPPFGPAAPESHRTCDNCHEGAQLAAGKFVFVGPQSSCMVCHNTATSGLEWSAVPEMHLECLNCHKAHTFQLADAADSCNVCHSDVIDKAPNDYHRTCFNCHANDHSFSFSGEQYSCQVCHAELVSEAPSEMHQQCSNCHKLDHTVQFAGVENSCKLCHGTPPGLHSGKGHQDCLNCHALHNFKTDANACVVCHGDLAQGHYQDYGCLDCHFYTADHPAPPSVAGLGELPGGAAAGGGK